MTRKIDEIGNRYGRLLVIEESGRSKGGKVLWRCICDCGKETVTQGNRLRDGRTRSCGCIQREMIGNLKRLPEGQAAFTSLYLRYRYAAERRGLIWKLTKEDVSFITKMSCHYCGAKPSQVWSVKSNNGGYTYNGIDRVDNSKGYILNNVVPCCRWCNISKGTRSVSEFIEHASKITSYRNDK